MSSDESFIKKALTVQVMTVVDLFDQGTWKNPLDARVSPGMTPPVCTTHLYSKHAAAFKGNGAAEALVKAGHLLLEALHIGETRSLTLEFINFRYPVAGDTEALAKVCCLNILIMLPSPTEPILLQAYAANIETFVSKLPNVKKLRLTWGVHRNQSLDPDLEPAESHKDFASHMYRRLQEIHKDHIKVLSVVVFGEKPGHDPIRHAAEGVNEEVERVRCFEAQGEEQEARQIEDVGEKRA